MRQETLLMVACMAVTVPALVLGAGRASGEEPSGTFNPPEAAFRPVATRQPRAPEPVWPGPSGLNVGVELLVPTPPPAARPTPDVPAAPALVVAVPRPTPALARSNAASLTGTPSVADAKAYALSQIGSSQFSCLDALWTRESNWNPYATNSSSGAYGIPQALPGDKMATFGADWQTNPVTQVKWGLSYIAGRYGTACAAWSHSQTYGWY